MELVTALSVGGACIGAYGAARLRYSTRRTHYRDMAARRRESLESAEHPVLAAFAVEDPVRSEFNANRIASVAHFLSPEWLAKLRDDALASRPHRVRSFIPTHKKGGTVSYEKMHAQAPVCISFFHSKELRRFVSSVVGMEVMPCADHDQSASSILFYEEAGDHIEWHFDHNFYRGSHFTVLLSLLNRGAEGGVSKGRLEWKEDGSAREVPMPENELAVFEGKQVLHRATPIAEGDFRVMLSMTFSTDPTLTLPKEIVRRCKDVAFFGLKALWT